MANQIKTNGTVEKERILSYKISQVLTEEELKNVSGAAAQGGSTMYSYNKHGKYDQETDDSGGDVPSHW